LHHAAVGFCDLAAQDQTDPTAAFAWGQEWNNKEAAPTAGCVTQYTL
jgi:N-acetyl-anhydromuramyl-L-alanine amidase AmpD